MFSMLCCILRFRVTSVLLKVGFPAKWGILRLIFLKGIMTMRLPALRKAGKAYAIRPVVGYSYTGFLGKQKSVGDEKAHLKDFLKSIFFA